MTQELSTAGARTAPTAASLCDALAEIGLADTTIPDLQTTLPRAFAGPAVTMRMRALEPGESADPAPYWAYFDSLSAGAVLVIACEDKSITALGGVASSTAVARGAAGAVTDCLIRDVEEIGGYGFPVRFAGARPSVRRGAFVEIGEPVEVAGVTVSAGDLVVADADGIVVVPSARTEAILERAAAIDEWEEAWAAASRERRSISQGYMDCRDLPGRGH